MTQPVLFALTDGKHSEVTEGGIIVPADAAERCAKAAEEHKRGDIAELRFCEMVRLRGYRFTLIGGQCRGYDVIVEKDGMRPVFAQVKHGFMRKSQAKKNDNRYHIANNQNGTTYGAFAFDILAFYMWDRDQWLLYTRHELGARTLTSYTPKELRTRKIPVTALEDRDPNNWELLDQVAAMYSQQSLGVTQQMSDPLPNTQ